MARKIFTQEELQEAIDLAELYGGTAWNIKKAKPELTISHNALNNRIMRARLAGIRPTVKVDAPRVYTRERLGRMHLIIPDVQAKPTERIDFLEWIGKYIADKRPDVIICIGDFGDVASLSRYDWGKLQGEGRRLIKDLDITKKAMRLLCEPFASIPGYKPEMHMFEGNHEQRMDTIVEDNPYLEGLIGTHLLNWEEFGWKVHKFLHIGIIDGVQYSHYFTSGSRGSPVSSARALVMQQGRSSIMGHEQKTDVAFNPKNHQWGIFSGLCNLHDEKYLGPQGNFVRRQILVLHEVEDGRFDPMFVSLRFLEKCYG